MLNNPLVSQKLSPNLSKIIFPVFLVFIILAVPFKAAAFTCYEWTEFTSACTTEPVLCEETPDLPANHVAQTVACDGGGQIVTCSWCTAPDEDDDGLVDAEDNCPLAVNADQADMDGDGIGDVCDPDMDGDGLFNDSETEQGTDPASADLINWVDDDDDACGGYSPCYDTIQAAIDASGGTTGYDIVVIRDGVYTGSGNYDLDFQGRAIIVRSESGADTTIIDCEKQGRGFYFHNAETRSAVVDGFTIRNGRNFDNIEIVASGGAILIEGASPTIRHCVFDANISTEHGGAISIEEGGSPVIEWCRFIDNRAYFQGGGIAVSDSQITLSGCRFENNTAEDGGALYYVDGSEGLSGMLVTDTLFEGNSAKLQGGAGFINGSMGAATVFVNCTLVKNTAVEGAAIWLQNHSFSGPSEFNASITLLNSIVHGNIYGAASGQIHTKKRTAGEVRVIAGYSLLEGGLSAVAVEDGADVVSQGQVINTNPGFVFDDNYHLAADSAAIDAGAGPGVISELSGADLASTDLEGSTRNLGDAPDLGVYEYGGENAPEFMVSPPTLEFSMVTGRGTETITDAEVLSLKSYTDATAQGWEVILPAECSWLSAESELTGESAGEIDQVTFRADTAGLGHGTHTCSVSIVAENNPEAPITVPVELKINSTITVNGTNLTIQEGINMAADGDTVLVLSGTYGGTGNRDIDFRGKAIRVVAEESGFSIVDCDGEGQGFLFISGETPRSVLRGFKLINASGGAAVEVVNSSPLISECIFDSNTSGTISMSGNSDVVISDCSFTENSGSMYLTDSTVELQRCLFSMNTNYYYGGGLYGENSSAVINACRFIQNRAEGSAFSKGAAIAWIGSGSNTMLQITNSTFDRNMANYSGGAIYIWASYTGGNGTAELINNTFVGNQVTCTPTSSTDPNNTCGGGAIYSDRGGFNLDIVNSIFMDNSADRGSNLLVRYDTPTGLTLSHNAFSPEVIDYTQEIDYVDICDTCIEIPDNGESKLVDAANGDLRLKADSDFVDAGTPITGMYTDLRGSVRPVDGPDADDTPQFDIGAFEYSANYSGEEDGVVSAFRDVRVKSPVVMIDYEYQLVWKDKDPFPWTDPRFSQVGEYTLRFALVDKLGRRIDLGTFTEIKGPSGVDYEYSVAYTFNRSHIGYWYLRVEVADTPELYALSDEPFSIDEGTAQNQTIGVAVPNPLPEDNAYRNVMPDLDPSGLFYWSTFSNQLYAVAPGYGIVTWYEDEYRTVPVPKVVSNQMPETVQFHIANTPAVELLPDDSPFESVRIMYSTSEAQLVGSQFTATDTGFTVLLYYDDDDGTETFEVVRTVLWNDTDYLTDRTWNIGQTIVETALHDPECGGGWVVNEISPYDGAGTYMAYDRDERTGPIIPVNTDKTDDEGGDDLVVVWYEKGITGVDWPHAAVHYLPRWPDEPVDPADPADADRVAVAEEEMKTITIGSSLGSGPLVADTYGDPDNMMPYNQPDDELPGMNPNEEHAFLAMSLDGTNNEPALFALRNDLNGELSDPYVLLKYRNPSGDDEWAMEVFKVAAPESTGPVDAYTSMTLNGVSGMLLNAPYPLPALYFSPCAGNGPTSYSPGTAAWKDKNGELWAMNPDDGNPTLNYAYPLKEGFYYDLDNDDTSDVPVGQCISWDAIHSGETEAKKMAVTYDVNWPDDVPVLQVGEALMDAKNGLPNIANQCSVGLEYGSDKVRLFDPLLERSVDLAVLFESLPNEEYDTLLETFDGIDFDEDLPFHLSARIAYDADGQTLSFTGYYDDSMAGEPLLLPNVMSGDDRLAIEALSDDGYYLEAVQALYDETRKFLGLTLHDEGHALDEPPTELTSETAETKALTAGAATAEGYVILSFNDAMNAEEEELCVAPVTLAVIRVECPSYTGDIKVIEPENVFDNRVTMRHSGDFGGEPDQVIFQWKWMDYVTNPPDPDDPDWNLWFEDEEDLAGEQGSKTGAVEIVVDGPGDKTLSDKWFIVRSYMENGPCGEWSDWTAPQLYQGWVKRVLSAINLFDQRIKNFEDYAPNTLASMVQQAGERYEGDAALNYDPDNLDSLGLIEFYQTILNLSLDLTIDAAEPIRTASSDQTLLLAASRLSDLFMLLGNDAYADAVDPTIGFSTDDTGEYGSAVTSIFCFQNQVASLLEEELALLRGRDDEGVRPFYNHLVWNFTQTEGEVAYRQNYNIFDWDGDGFLTEYDARTYYPQGHGDAWGYYLSGIKIYYSLLRHPLYVWEPRPESLLVAGTPVSVDYEDERRFAKSAAAKAKTGAEVVELTYRQHYDEDRDDQLDGHRDVNTDRAWGVDEWAARAGQAAYFDWVMANAILPAKDLEDCQRDGADPEDCHEGLALVDRTTVVEIREIPTTFAQIQTTADKADAGLNPLGLAKGAVPFDFDPTFDEVGSGIQNVVYFEQMYERAVDALSNAVTVFDHANENTQLLYQQQDSIGDFQVAVEAEERSFNNDLIEIFGYPYSDDCGPGKTYTSDYCESGPDVLHWMYVDGLEELVNLDEEAYQTRSDTATLSVDLDSVAWNTAYPVLEDEVITFETVTSKHFTGLAKPESWTGKRLAPGELQMAYSDLLQLIGEYRQSCEAYTNLLHEINDTSQLVSQQIDLTKETVGVMAGVAASTGVLNAAILVAKGAELGFSNAAELADKSGDIIEKGIPSIIGTIAGLSTGLIIDPGMALRPVAEAASTTGWTVQHVMAILAEMAGLGLEQVKENISLIADMKIAEYEGKQEIKSALLELQNLFRSEAELRIELMTLLEGVNQAKANIDAIKAAGERLLEERLIFRTLTAADVQAYRYKDMAFRLFRDDALRKYRSQFDMAALYTYLAAKAYDYETALLDSDTSAGRNFLADIVRQRSIGQVEDGEPLTGMGLADNLKRMKLNFQVFKSQMGINNPQFETNQFSLRRELFRFLPNEGSDGKWRETLTAARVDDLWQIPEFKRYCRPFADEGIAQPGIVLHFSTDVTAGQNFFGLPLGGGDSYYSAANFATKIWSAGIWFTNYDSSGLAMTPRVYLVPVGEDILRSPTDNSGDLRTWQVVDQKIPMPFPVSAAELVNNPNWIPQVDSLQDELFGIRRHSDFRAYHDSGYVDESEMTYDARLIGRSVWNTEWLLIIPGLNLYYDAEEGVERFINGPETYSGSGVRTDNGVKDIKLYFYTYSFTGD